MRYLRAAGTRGDGGQRVHSCWVCDHGWRRGCQNVPQRVALEDDLGQGAPDGAHLVRGAALAKVLVDPVLHAVVVEHVDGPVRLHRLPLGERRRQVKLALVGRIDLAADRRAVRVRRQLVLEPCDGLEQRRLEVRGEGLEDERPQAGDVRRQRLAEVAEPELGLVGGRVVVGELGQPARLVQQRDVVGCQARRARMAAGAAAPGGRERAGRRRRWEQPEEAEDDDEAEREHLHELCRRRHVVRWRRGGGEEVGVEGRETACSPGCGRRRRSQKVAGEGAGRRPRHAARRTGSRQLGRRPRSLRPGARGGLVAPGGRQRQARRV